MIFPWQVEQWQHLLRLHQTARLPHALLFTGISGLGKREFAQAFCGMVLCQQPKEGQPCLSCHACHLVTGSTHPNVLWIQPEKEGQAIKVDQIRQIIDFSQQSSLQGKHRIIVLFPAENMNMSAANALLKTLEEPAEGAILILISNQSERLLPTILSRCQRFIFLPPERSVALAWLNEQVKRKEIDHELLLNLAQGAPLTAQALMTSDSLNDRQQFYDHLHALHKRQVNPLQIVSDIKLEPLAFIDLFLSWITDLMRLQLGETTENIVNSDFVAQLSELKTQKNLQSQAALLMQAQRIRQQICLGMNVNKQLMMETLLIQWMR